jgi:hypothetical protein
MLWKALLITLAAVAFATTVHAQCAWVLWGQTVTPTNYLSIFAMALGSWPAREDCETARVAKEANRQTGDLKYFFTCLPDTIDPRGPKGGAR